MRRGSVPYKLLLSEVERICKGILWGKPIFILLHRVGLRRQNRIAARLQIR